MKSGLKPNRDFASFSPAKELKRSESEEAGLSKEQESSGSEQGEDWQEQQSLAENSQEGSDLQDQETGRRGDEDYETPESHHFRGSSFGNESDPEDTPGSNFERLVTSYEKSLERQQTLDQQMKDLHQAHTAQQDMWESRYKRATLDLERLTQRNEELLELLSAKEAELSRLREDVETLRRDARESRAVESRTKEVIRKLEEELVRSPQGRSKTRL